MAKPDNKKAGGKTAKAPKAVGEAFDREAEEARLGKKYPKQKIVKGSLRDAGEVPEFGQKRTIEIVCQGDGKTKRRIATSDLHQVKYSAEYMKGLRLQRRKKARSADKPAKPKATDKRGRAAKPAKPVATRTRKPKAAPAVTAPQPEVEAATASA